MSSLRRFCEPDRDAQDRQSAGDGDKKEFVAEESTKETVKTIARGKPGDFRRTRGDYPVLTTDAQGLRVLRAPGFPCSLFFMRGTMLMQTSGKPCREKAKARLSPRHCEESLRRSNPALLDRRSGLLDCFAHLTARRAAAGSQ